MRKWGQPLVQQGDYPHEVIQREWWGICTQEANNYNNDNGTDSAREVRPGETRGIQHRGDSHAAYSGSQRLATTQHDLHSDGRTFTNNPEPKAEGRLHTVLFDFEMRAPQVLRMMSQHFVSGESGTTLYGFLDLERNGGWGVTRTILTIQEQ